MINKIGAYKAAIVRLDGHLHAFIQLRDGSVYINSVPMVSESKEYVALTEYDIELAWMGFTSEDGKKNFEFEDLVEHNPDFEGVAFELENIDIVQIHDEDKVNFLIEDLVEEDEIEPVLIDLFNDIYKTPEWESN